MSSNKNQAKDALKPKNVSTPFGSVNYSKGSQSYTPNYLPGQQDILNNSTSQAGDLLKNSLPSMTSNYQGTLNNYLGATNSLNGGNLVNPQVYSSAYGLLANPLMSQYQMDTNNLNNNLAAQNLTGGSYDAMAHGQLDKNLGFNLGQAANQAYLSGLGATGDYLGWLQNAASTAGQGVSNIDSLINNLQGLSQNTQNQVMAPYGQAAQYQSVLNPLQTATASYVGQPSIGYQMLNTFGNQFAQGMANDLTNPIGVLKGTVGSGQMGSGTGGGQSPINI